MKVSIIGSNSYIARNVMFVIKERYPECRINLYDFAEHYVDGDSNYKSVRILDKESVKEIEMNCDLIFMFVGKTGSLDGFEEYDTYIDINEKALLNVLNEYRRQNSTAKIVFPSTRLVYKGTNELLKEDAEKEFKTVYSITKYACEKYLEQFHRMYGVKYVIFRICVPFGTLIPQASSYGTAEFMLNKARSGLNICLYGDGSVRRTLTFIGDVCDVLIEASLCEECSNDVFNIGGEDYSLREMAELIAVQYKVNVEYVEYPEASLKIESGSTVFDNLKLRKIYTGKNEMKFADWCRKSLILNS